VRWRGSFDAPIHDVSDNSVEIVPDLVGCDSKSFNSALLNAPVPSLVMLDRRREVVSEPIDFNCERRGLAVEIEDERAKRMLSAEVQPFGSQAQDSPEPDLGRAHPFA